MRRGITLTVLVAAVAIMGTLITSTIVYATSSISTANYERFKNEITNMYDLVNVYYLENNELPVTNETVSAISISKEFSDAVEKNGDSENELMIINTYLLKNLNIKIGKGNFENKDVFVVSDKSHNIYYLKGYNYKGNVIYNM